MPVSNIPSLKAGVTNAELLQVAINGANVGYKGLIPSPTVAGVEQTVRYLDQHRQLWNPVYSSLLNQIGTIITRANSWSNPLAEFKRGMIEYGNGIEEFQTGLVRAYGYDANRSFGEKMAFGTHKVPLDTSFHEKNRQDMFAVSVERAMVRSAFLSEDSLGSLLSQVIAAPSESDKWAEFGLMTSLLSAYERHGGFYKVHTRDVGHIDSDGSDAKHMLRRVRAVGENMLFRSTKYNSAGFPVAAKREDLILITTPEVSAALDVEALAALFHTTYADVPYRVISIPAEYFPQKGAQAILCDKNFFVVADTLLETRTMENPVEPSQYNTFLHHHQIISCSRFVPAVMFWTGADSEVVEIVPPVSKLENVKLYDQTAKEVTTLTRGAIYQADVTATGGGTNPAIQYTITGATDIRTSISPAGVLTVGGRERGPITVVAECDGVKAQAVFSAFDGAEFPAWPDLASELTGIVVLGRVVSNFKVDTKEYSIKRASKDLLGQDGGESRVYATGTAIGTVVSVAKGADGYVVKVSVLGLDGKDYGTYTVNVV